MDPAAVRDPLDAVLVCVKATQLAGVAAALRELGRRADVFFALNGIPWCSNASSSRLLRTCMNLFGILYLLLL